MYVLSSLIAVSSLLFTVAVLPLAGGVIFAIVFFGLFLLALVAVVGGVEDRRVRPRNPSMSATGWRGGRERRCRSSSLESADSMKEGRRDHR